MLNLKITGISLEELTSEHIKNQGSKYSVYRGNKSLAAIQGTGKEVEFQIDPYLDLEEFQFLREIILEIGSGNGTSLDESGCQLGYLENGEKAFLIENWDEWKTFLMKAKLKTLEGQSVQAMNNEGEELGSGLLAEYDTAVNPFRITSCTLITLFGERKFEGDNLSIVPTNQFS